MNQPNKLKICQHGTDGFGHQLEGMLRLISISLNNKAEYMYDFKKKFVFEHSNFDAIKLNSYLLKALDLLSNNSTKNTTTEEYKTKYEHRCFNQIIASLAIFISGSPRNCKHISVVIIS